MKRARRVAGIGVVALTLLSGACSSSSDAPAPLSGSGNLPVSEPDPVTGTVGFYMPPDPQPGDQPALQPGADPGQAALGYLQANGPALGIPDASVSYKPVEAAKEDDDNTTHVKLQQVSNGIEVWGIVTTVHFDDAGFVDAVDGPYIPNLDAISKEVPTVSDDAGKATAAAEVTTLLTGALGATALDASLVIYVDDDYSNPRLARHYSESVWTADFVEGGEVFVDALTGEVIASWIDSSSAEEQKQVDAPSYDGQTHSTPVDEMSSSDFRHGRLETATQSLLMAGKWKDTGTTTTWEFLDQPTLAGPWDPQAVEALLNVDRTERFYLSTLSWDGANGDRSNVFVAVRDPDEDGYVNSHAYWATPNQNTLTFTKAGTHDEKSPVIGIYIVGHEWTHLVTHYTSKLVYRTEPGAINESFSDIFGAFVERSVTGTDANVYLIGEAKGQAWRDMRHPTQGACTTCVDNYSKLLRLPKGTKPNNDGNSKKYNDSGYVHSNSSIVNNAWAIMNAGGTNDTSKMTVQGGMGWDKSIAWWWKTQRHLATARMAIPRLARLQSGLSKKSKGRYVPKIVACSWAAVGAIDVAWARKNLAVECEESAGAAGGTVGGSVGDGTVGPSLCQGKADGTYCKTAPADLFGFVCKDQMVVDNLVCAPPNTHCTGPSPDGKSLVCTD